MKLFGHPIHPLVIHFPTALLPMDFVLSVLYHSTGNHSFYQAGFYCLVGGAAMGLVAMMTGLADLLSIPRSDKKAIALGLYHAYINGFIIIIFAIIAYKAWQVFPSPFLSGTKGILIKGLLIVSLFVGNYFGGKLIYKYFVGINLNTQYDGKASTENRIRIR